MGINWTDSWVFYKCEKISLRSSDLLLIISVWYAMTYLATSNETSLEAGMDYLTLALRLDWSIRICWASPLYIKATSLSSSFLSLRPTLVPISFWEARIKASVLFKYSFKKSRYFLGSAKSFLWATLAYSVILWY